MQEGSLFSALSPAFIVCRLFDDGHSDQCRVISHCSFDLHFSNNKIFLSLLAICCLYNLFLRNICLGLLRTFWLCCLFFWYWAARAACLFYRLILVSFICYYFLLFWGLSFHLVYSFLCCAKAFNLNCVPLVYFYFHYSRRWVLEVLWFMSKCVQLMFSSISLTFYLRAFEK